MKGVKGDFSDLREIILQASVFVTCVVLWKHHDNHIHISEIGDYLDSQYIRNVYGPHN